MAREVDLPRPVFEQQRRAVLALQAGVAGIGRVGQCLREHARGFVGGELGAADVGLVEGRAAGVVGVGLRVNECCSAEQQAQAEQG